MLCFVGQFGFPGEGGHQPEPGRAQQPDVRGGTAPDLHAHAQRLIPTFPQLICLQGPPGTKESLLRHLKGSSQKDLGQKKQKKTTRTTVPLQKGVRFPIHRASS